MSAALALTPEDAELYKAMLANLPYGHREPTVYNAVTTIAEKYDVPVYKVFDALGELLGRSPAGIASAYYRSRREALTSAGGSYAKLASEDISADFETINAAFARILKHVQKLEASVARHEVDQERFQEVRALLSRPAP